MTAIPWPSRRLKSLPVTSRALKSCWPKSPTAKKAPASAMRPSRPRSCRAPSSRPPEWLICPRKSWHCRPEAAFSEEEVAVEPSPLADVSMTTQEELPEVITADMLRARMAERKKFNFADEDFEVPAELLAGYDEEELDEKTS